MRPSSLEKMRAIYGIGEHKLAQFGDKVLQVILQHCQANGVPLDQRVDLRGWAYATDPAYVAELAAYVDEKMCLAARESPAGDSATTLRARLPR